MATTNEQISVIVKFVDQLSGGIDKAQAKVKNFKNVVDTAANAFKPLSLAAGAALGLSAKRAVDFDKALTRLNKTANLSAKELAEFRDGAFELQKRLNFQLGVDQLVRLQAESAKLGVSKRDLDGYTEAIVKFAVAADELQNIDAIAEQVAKMNASFKLSVRELDIFTGRMNQVADAAATSEKHITDFLSRVAGSAAVYNVPKEQVLALGTALLDTGTHAGTASRMFNNLFTKLGSPAAATKQAREAFDLLGTSAEEMAQKFNQNPRKAIDDLLNQLEQLQSTDPIKMRNIMSLLAGGDFSDDFAKLINNLDKYRELLNLTANDADALAKKQREFNIQSSSVTGQLETLKNILDTIGISIGEALLPGIIEVTRSLANMLIPIAGWIKANPGVSKAIAILLGITAVIAPILMLTSAIAGMVSTIATIAPIIGGAVAAIATIAAPVTLTVVAIAGLTAAGIALVQNWDFVKAKAGENWNAIGRIIGNVVRGIGQIINFLNRDIRDVFSSMINHLKKVEFTWDGLDVKAKQVMPQISAAVRQEVDTMKMSWNALGEATNQGVKRMAIALGKGIQDFYNWAGNIGKAIQLGAVNFVNNVNAMIGNLNNIIDSFVQNTYQQGIKWGKGLIQGFINGMQSLYGDVQNAMTNFTNWLQQYLPSSDAKKGALSKLSQSGAAFTNTFLGAAERALYNPLQNLNAPGQFRPATVPPIQSPANRTYNITNNYNITGNNSDDIVEKLRKKERDFLTQFRRSEDRIDRRAY